MSRPDPKLACLVHFDELRPNPRGPRGGLVKLIGVILIVLGIVALVFGGIRYTTRETVVDIGPVKATADKEHNIPLSPIVGLAAVAAGIACVVAGSRARV